ncbi:MAG: HemK/PrmC family methyltransferase, partial [Mobilitalea sp.]
MSNYKELLRAARIILKEHEIADADVDAWYLLAHVFGINRTYLFLHDEESVTEEDAQRYQELVDLRASHIPLQHLTGTQEFMGLEFEVSEDVLIPRQDTETLVEEVLKVCDNKTVLDMCTGSGCIIVSLARLAQLKKAVGVDISEKALVIAKKNANKHQVEIEYFNSDLFDNITGKYDIIVSNTTYIPRIDIEDLMPEV